MNFIRHEFLWLLPVVLLAGVLLWCYADWQKRRVLKNFTGGGAVIVCSYPKRMLRRIILMTAMLLLCVVTARPGWGERPLEFNLSESDVLIVFDVSKSMLAEDVAPSRLEHGKFLARELVKSNPRTGFGFVAFAGRAFPLCPLTADPVSLEQCIDELECDLVPVGGTNLAEALKMALKALKASGNVTREVVLITDGEELSGSVRKELAELKKNNIRLLVVGLGNPAVPALIPEVDGSGKKHFKRDRNDALVKSQLNEKLLQELARETNGIYVNSNTSESRLTELNAALADGSGAQEKNIKRTLPIERFMIFLVLAAAGVIAYMLIDECTAQRKRFLPLLLFCLLISANSAKSAENAENPAAGSTLPENKAPQELLTEVQDHYKLYAEARRLQQEKKFADAVRLYEELLKTQVAPQIRSAAAHNLGVIEHESARRELAAAQQKSSSGNLDDALKNIDNMQQKLLKAQDLYVDSMLQNTNNEEMSTLTGRTQQQLLLDLQTAEKLKKAIEEYKKKLEQAKKNTQKAQQQNQKQQQGQQNQQGQQQSGNAAQDALKDAQQAAQELEKQAGEISEDLKEEAQNASDALDKAAEKQEKGDYKGAADDIEKALKELQKSAEKASPKPDKPGKQDQQKTQKTSQEQKSADKDQPQAQGSEPRAAEKSQNENKMDASQTDALLDLMMQDEKNLRDAVKRSRNRRIAPVEKDW